MKSPISIAALALCACASTPTEPPAPPQAPCGRMPLTHVDLSTLRGPEGFEALLAARNAELAEAEQKHCWIGPPR